MLPLAFLLLLGCEKNEVDLKVSSEAQTTTFQPTKNVQLINGMLSFDSKFDFDVTKLEIAATDQTALNKWEQQIGITTPRQIFYQVVQAEDSISNYYYSLPEREQQYWRSQPEVNSNTYKKAMEEGVLTVVKDKSDGSEYFDYNYYDKSVTGVVNKEGFVMVAGQIHQYTSNGIKIILDGDFSKIKELENINKTHIGDNLRVTIYDDSPIKTRGIISGYHWSVNRDWEYPTKRKRVKVEIEGHSEAYGNPVDDSCAQQLNCIFNSSFGSHIGEGFK